MPKAPPTNLAASVHHRLVRIAHDRRDEAQAILGQYGVERLLYRLTCAKDTGPFILKGALLFAVWENMPRRPTADGDLLGPGLGTPATMLALFRSVCSTAVEPDGLTFDPERVKTSVIRDDQEYPGVRVNMVARLGKAIIPVQIDVGFGDAVTPSPIEATLPALLNFPPVQIGTYPPETVIAEKCHATVALGTANTRMKDYYDLWVLSETHEFDGALVVAAVIATFTRRMQPPLPPEIPVGLTPAFGTDPTKQRLWAAFLVRARLTGAPPDFAVVVDRVASFLQPVLIKARDGIAWSARWLAGNAWSVASDR